jgi:lysophospholipase L1-like esterase
VKVRERVYRQLASHARRVHGHGPLLVAIGDSNTDPRCAYTLPRQVWLRIVGREGYKTLNLGVSGDTTGDMRRRIEQTLSEGQPEIAVVFGGVNDAQRDVDPAKTERNVAFMARWLRDRGIRKIVLIGPALVNWQPTPDWASSAADVQKVLSDVAQRHGAVCVDLALFLRSRIDRGEDPDFSRVPYSQSHSWHVAAGDPHLNAYGQRLAGGARGAAGPGGFRDGSAPGGRALDHSNSGGGPIAYAVAPDSRTPTGFAGTPATTVIGATSFVTTDPTATTAPRPTVTPGRMVARDPIHT